MFAASGTYLIRSNPLAIVRFFVLFAQYIGIVHIFFIYVRL